ncbi:MAG: hypothetical protein WCL18_01835 [bacterium]
MKTSYVFSLMLLLSILCACKKDSPKDNFIGTCPCNTDVIYWRDHLGYGTWRCGYTYIDGNICIATGGAVAINIRSDCAWKFYGDNIGGTGNIYQVIPADTSIRFTWEYNALDRIEVFSHWKGNTERGSSMGKTIAQFLQIEPGFSVTSDSTVYVYTTSAVSVTAEFTTTTVTVGKLKKLTVDAK